MTTTSIRTLIQTNQFDSFKHTKRLDIYSYQAPLIILLLAQIPKLHVISFDSNYKFGLYLRRLQELTNDTTCFNHLQDFKIRCFNDDHYNMEQIMPSHFSLCYRLRSTTTTLRFQCIDDILYTANSKTGACLSFLHDFPQLAHFYCKDKKHVLFSPRHQQCNQNRSWWWI